jgi:hypothetical protein
MSSTIPRFYCARCAESVFNCIIDGVRIPIVLQFNVGQAPDTGPPLGINDAGVKLPSWIREMMQLHVPSANGNLCMKCVAEVFGTPCLTPDEDPMFSLEQAEISGGIVATVVADPEIDQRTTNATIFQRVFEAVQVGRGARQAPALPPPRPVEIPAPTSAVATAEPPA